MQLRCSKLPLYPAAGQGLCFLNLNVVAVLRIIPRYRVNIAGGKLLSLPECHSIGGKCIDV